MDKWRFFSIIVILIILLAIIFGLGIYGEKRVQEETSRCTLGVEGKWCWLWETHVYEEVTKTETVEYNSVGV